jgi:TonB family protein
MKYLFTTAFIVFATQAAFAQRQNVYFLKNNGRYVDVRDSADYIRIVREPDSASTLYNVFEFYLNGAKKLTGRSSKINPPQYQGVCVTYYANGQRESVVSYKNGSRAGDDIEFYPNGRLYTQFTYPEDNKDYSPFFGGYLIKTNTDSLGTPQVTDGNGYYKAFDGKFKYVDEEGPVKDGKRDGQWKGNFQSIHTTFTETYDNGLLVSGTATTKDGKVNTYIKSRWVSPQFKGGVEAFGRYLSRKINYADEARRQNIQGTVILTFVVEKDGSLTDIRVVRSVAAILDDEAVRVLKDSPKWLPGTQFGLPSRVQYTVPVSFALAR